MFRWLTSVAGRAVVLALGIATTVIAAISDCPIVAIAAPLAAALVMTLQFFSFGPSVVPFGSQDWRRTENGWTLEVPWRRHLRFSPNAQVWQRRPEDRVFEAVICDIQTKGHTVVVEIGEAGADTPFGGEIRIS